MKKIFVAGAGLVVRPLVGYLLDQPDLPGRGRATSSRTGRRGSSPATRAGRPSSWTSRTRPPCRRGSPGPTWSSAWSRTRSIRSSAGWRSTWASPMVTASYVSPAMKALDEDARRKGVILLNELGLDPGIDHMEAMRVIHRIKGGGGEVLGFVSWCGGLPAPEANTNPFGYKFSWSPKGVLLAGKNSARYLEDGKIVFIPSEKLFESCRTGLRPRLRGLRGLSQPGFGALCRSLRHPRNEDHAPGDPALSRLVRDHEEDRRPRPPRPDGEEARRDDLCRPRQGARPCGPGREPQEGRRHGPGPGPGFDRIWGAWNGSGSSKKGRSRPGRHRPRRLGRPDDREAPVRGRREGHDRPPARVPGRLAGRADGDGSSRR